MFANIRLGIAVLSGRDHNPKFVKCLTELLVVLASDKLLTFSTMFRDNVGCLSAGRQLVLDQAIERGLTHLLYIDDDMTFPVSVAYDLLRHDVDVVALNAVRKDPAKLTFCARYNNGEEVSSLGKHGLEQVRRVGMGVCLVRVEAAARAPKPHFEVVYNRTAKAYISEDYYFCDHLHAVGSKIYVDHEASQKVGHVGDYVFGIDGAVVGAAIRA